MIVYLAFVFFAIALANALFWPRVRRACISMDAAIATGGLAVCIPARNEEQNIGDCLRSVLAQGSLISEIWVYDDHSDDGTAAIVNGTGDSRVHLLHPSKLPPGWYGKTFACAQLARSVTTRWILFLDADARLHPDACARMLSEAQRRKLTFLSCWPRFDMRTWAERILMPMLNFVVFSVFPGPMSPWRKETSLGLAHGACILVERDAYDRVGGHAAVRDEIFEDTRMAQLWRVRCERGLCLDGLSVVSVRMYASLEEIWRGFTKNFYLAFRHPVNFWIFLLLHFSVFLLPFLGFSWRAAVVVLLLRIVLAMRFGQGWWSALAHPFAEALVLAIGIGSWRRARSSQGIAWKGRHYPVARS